MDKQKLVSFLYNIDDDNILNDDLKNRIMKGEINTVKELLKEIQNSKKVIESNKKLRKYKDFLNEELKYNKDQEYTVIQFWNRYLRFSREAMINYIKDKDICFKTNSKGLKEYEGKVNGLLPAYNHHKKDIIILFNTRQYGVLKVDNKYPIIVKEN